MHFILYTHTYICSYNDHTYSRFNYDLLEHLKKLVDLVFVWTLLLFRPAAFETA